MQPTLLLREFISIFNLIRNSFARDYFSTCFVSVTPYARRWICLSIFFSDLLRSPLSFMAPTLPLPLYFPHEASLSLTLLSSSSSSSLFNPPRTTSLSLSRIVADFPYLLHDLSPAICYSYLRPRSDTPVSYHPSTLICSAKFPEKATISRAHITAARRR